MIWSEKKEIILEEYITCEVFLKYHKDIKTKNIKNHDC